MYIRKADDIAAAPVEMKGAHDVKIRLLVAQDQQAPNFYMRQFDVAPGGCTPEHSHPWEHECYILSGQATMTTAEGDRTVSAGDVLYVAPDEIHQFRNTGSEELKFLCLVPKPSS
ncbi:MAG: cupin domain-containing protein [Phycisphaerae bacterium]